MSFLKKLFGSKDEVKIIDNAGFWNWFVLHEKSFFHTIESRNNVERDFLNKIMPKLQQLNDQFYSLAGMYDDTTAELIISAEGDIKTFVFVEELVAAAPAIEGWKFTALKPSHGIMDMSIQMDGYLFDSSKLSFFSNPHADYPDEIDITMVHADFNETDEKTIANGTFIYLDNALGELNVATLLDSIQVGSGAPGQELINIEKLQDFLLWREKEFVEKYKGARYNTENDEHAVLEGKDDKDLPVIAIIDQELLQWDAKPSHPWLMAIEIKYEEGNNGLPDSDTYELIRQFEDELFEQLPDSEGYLNPARETYNGTRTIYFACKEFRNSSKIAAACIYNYQEKLDISYDIYKDKYWMSVERFMTTG
jgi:hypothetical protein